MKRRLQTIETHDMRNMGTHTQKGKTHLFGQLGALRCVASMGNSRRCALVSLGSCLPEENRNKKILMIGQLASLRPRLMGIFSPLGKPC